MPIIKIFINYFNYLIHPFKTHEKFLHPERFENVDVMRLSAYESLTTSWIFVIINGILKIILLNFVLLFIIDIANSSEFDFGEFFNLKEFPALYFLVLSAITDIIFYPLFGIFIIQFWELVIRFFGRLNGIEGDLTQKTQDILAVKFSSKILTIIPFLGSTLESMAKLILMYAGLRTQLKTSIPLTLCIMFTPFLLMLVLCAMTVTFMLVLI